ncbi:MAG: MotA/TolQ/ExbB proton channel family protein [Planctomycetota bacterium]|nr:MotA/TolQ/ExbB proton channel family protein [Planctomycetota bacterium]MDA1105366.1 MotA/TolQ/ExbB proton channel family protein [Planctomycetota bacterium]
MSSPLLPLDASRGDPECLLGLSSNRSLSSHGPLWLGVSLVVTGASAAAFNIFADWPLSVMMNRCWTNYACVLAALWAILMLTAKLFKVRVQCRALDATDLLPRRTDFILSPATAPEVLARINGRAVRPREFLVFNRLWSALSNLGNIGEVRDVGAVLESQADSDASALESSYTAIRALIWTVPVFGFIGTVIGLGDAIGNFQAVLTQDSGDASSIRDSLSPVIAGLATAFETTLVALVLAVIVQLYSTFVYKQELGLLDRVETYCHDHVITRLRLMDPR